MSTPQNSVINWELVRTKVPETIVPLINEFEKLCAENPHDPARAIDLKVQARLAHLRLEFEQLKSQEKA